MANTRLKIPTPIITSLLENDAYKFSMGQAIYHQFPGYKTTWEFRCRNKGIHFTKEMVEDIINEIRLYCTLRFTEQELAYLKETTPWIKGNYIDFLHLWHPNFDDIHVSDKADCGLAITATGTWLNTSMYEVPILAIVNEVYFRHAYDYDSLFDDFRRRTDAKFDMLKTGKWYAGTFSEFGLRRRLSAQAQAYVVEKFAHLNDTMHSASTFVGTSNVLLAKENNVKKVGTQAHEWIMGVGQGNPRHNPAYSNYYAMKAWIEEYGVQNGIALTDTIGTKTFLKDFDLTFATLFSGVRHDSGDPYKWGDMMLDHYAKLGIDARTKTLLFSDSLDFERADKLFRYFNDKTNVAFGIGTYLANDTYVEPLNIVMKMVRCNGSDVAKVSDAPGKGMCCNPGYVDYIKRSIDWRLTNA